MIEFLFIVQWHRNPRVLYTSHIGSMATHKWVADKYVIYYNTLNPVKTNDLNKLQLISNLMY